MSVFNQVLVAEDLELGDLSEDIPLTKELVRFASVHLGARARTLEDLMELLFGEPIAKDCLRCITRRDRTEVLLGLGMLSVLKPIFFA